MPFAATDFSLASLLPRVFISMLVVIAVMWFAARVMRNKQMPGGSIVRAATSKRETPMLQVLARHGLGRNASVTVVQAGDKTLVLGITEQRIALLTELTGETAEATHDAAESPMATPVLHAIPTDNSSTGMRTRSTRTAAFSTSQWTGSSRNSAPAGSRTARKGLLEQVREMTVRKA